jgi:hypothetical protein
MYILAADSLEKAVIAFKIALVIDLAHRVFSTKVLDFHILKGEIMQFLTCNTSVKRKLSFSPVYNIVNQRNVPLLLKLLFNPSRLIPRSLLRNWGAGACPGVHTIDFLIKL